MLSDELFSPLDLDDALEAAFDKGGREDVVALLEAALNDPRAEGDESVADYLDELIEQLTELKRYPEAIAATYRLIELDDELLKAEELGSIAHLHALNGEVDAAERLLGRLRAEHEALEPADRDYYTALLNTLVVADELGDQVKAVDWLSEDLRAALEVHLDPDLILGINGHRKRLAGADFADRGLDAEVERYLKDNKYVPPEAEDTTPRAPRLLWSGEQDRRELELAMRADGTARLVDADGDVITWPPGRNDPCWCGSGSKYKKCCGTPG